MLAIIVFEKMDNNENNFSAFPAPQKKFPIKIVLIVVGVIALIAVIYAFSNKYNLISPSDTLTTQERKQILNEPAAQYPTSTITITDRQKILNKK